MTRLDLQSRLQNHFQNSVYYTSIDFNDSIQDGFNQISAFSGCLYGSGTLIFTQYKTYYDLLALFPNYVGIVAMFNAAIRRWMFPTSLKKLNQVRIDWDSTYGTPYYFVPINHRYVAIYMKPGTAGYGSAYIFYRASAPVLTDGTAIEIPDEHITVLEDYCKMDLWEQAQEFGKAEEATQTYLSNLERLRVLVRNQRNRDRYMSLR